VARFFAIGVVFARFVVVAVTVSMPANYSIPRGYYYDRW
jgi:hypothetical protein